MNEFDCATEQGTISYLSSWIEDMEDRIQDGDPRAMLYEERIMFLKKAKEMCEIYARLVSRGKMMEWISVNERLPECDAKWGISKIVLCVDAKGRRGLGIYQNGETQLQSKGWFTGGEVGENSVKVTHWMPLPEAAVRE